MICPRCKREVENVWGDGEFPNSSYRCQRCCDADTSKTVGYFFLAVASLMLLCLIPLLFGLLVHAYRLVFG